MLLFSRYTTKIRVTCKYITPSFKWTYHTHDVIVTSPSRPDIRSALLGSGPWPNCCAVRVSSRPVA